MPDGAVGYEGIKRGLDGGVRQGDVVGQVADASLPAWTRTTVSGGPTTPSGSVTRTR